MKDNTVLNNATDPQADEPDLNIAAPKPNDAMLYGLAGEIGKSAAKATEANPYATVMGFLTLLSAESGRNIYLPVGNTYHHPRLYNLHVGRSGRGRKGEAWSLPNKIREEIKRAYSKLNPDLLGQIHTGGLSSKEGLTLFIHDGYKEGKTEVEPVKDKRLLIIESEFANVLHQSRREGNTLSSGLRDAWDGLSIKPATKNNRIWASDPHIALLANITPTELIELMQSRELTNGFANRFLIFWAERDKLVPFPVPTEQSLVTNFAHRTAEIIKWAKGDYPNSQNSHRASLKPSAGALYSDIYYELAKPIDGGLIDAILERRPPNLLRLALLFAITDKTLMIEQHHIDAAMAWIQYCTDSVKFIFSRLNNEHEAEKSKEMAAEIVNFLKTRESATRTEISNHCFKRNKSAAEIDHALQLLLSESPPPILLEEMPRPKGQQGNPIKSYRLSTSTNCTNSTKSEEGRGFEQIVPVTKSNELYELPTHQELAIRTIRNSSLEDKIAAGLDIPDISYNSYNSFEDEGEI